jgi:uncharacterized membrane protein YGL010W
MKTIHDWLSAYGESHQNPTNKLVHWICVPSIMFSLIGLLTNVQFGGSLYFNLGTMLILFTLGFYLRLSWQICLAFIPVSFLMVWGNVALKEMEIAGTFMALWQFSLAVFAVAWIGQFIGHKIEGKKPSFFDDLKFLLIGPAWLMSFIFERLGMKY